MIRINLLPVKQLKKKKRLRNEVIVFSAAFVGLLLILALVGLGLSQKISHLKGDIAGLQRKKASYQPILNKIKKLQADKKKLETKLAAIKELKQDSQLTVRVLDEVASRTPSSRLWLKSLKQSKGQLQLAGVALDNATIAQFMQQLNASPYFADADLSSSSQLEIAGRKLKSFSLTLRVKQPEPQEQPSSQDKKTS